jgi:hypothetical protein
MSATKLARVIGITLVAIAAFVAPIVAQDATEELDQVLRAWILQNVSFDKDQENREILFIRKRPVRAYIRSDDPELAAEARNTVANLANAFGLEYSFTTSGVNMIIATAIDIAGGGRPNRALLGSLGLPESAIDSIADTTKWATGCGTYGSRDSDGRVSFSIALGDKGLSPKKQKSCIVTGIIFGFGLRITGQEILDYSNDYTQFLLLARSLVACEKKISEQIIEQPKPTRDVYVECVLNRLRLKLSD